MTYTYFDIETSGLRHDDIFLSYAYKKDSWEDERPVAVTLGIDYQNEKDLLRSLQGIVEGTLVMYNGETYRGRL
jgi:uncharacterized protein YprB with RNaseH-like and TPR domain